MVEIVNVVPVVMVVTGRYDEGSGVASVWSTVRLLLKMGSEERDLWPMVVVVDV